MILLGNPIEHIPFPQENLHTSQHTTTTTTTNSNNNNNNNTDNNTSRNICYQHQCLFQNVHTLGLSETLINQWESIDALNEWMPSLTNLRLGNTLPVFQVCFLLLLAVCQFTLFWEIITSLMIIYITN